VGRETLGCRLRGRLRLEQGGILTGDRVELELTGPGEGVITAVLPRRTELRRPPIANVDLTIVVFTLRSPPLNLQLVDRLLALARHEGLEVVLCLNKMDLYSGSDVSHVREYYAGSGFELVVTSAKLRENLEELVKRIGGRVAVLAGQSGVGKSTLLNAVVPGAELAVGELSPKVQRGRHITRSVRLMPVGDGLVADSPGFVNLDLPAVEPRELAGLYPEMAPFAAGCRFADCLHDPEPGCAVKAAVAQGLVNEGRYQGYLDLLHELQSRPKY